MRRRHDFGYRGIQNPGFIRSVKLMDRLAAEIEEQVMIQFGSSCYLPQFTTSFPCASPDEMKRLFQLARSLVTHAEIGVIIQALRVEKPLLVVP
jgi:UDP-N-acetylglucosamine transferase subunit ALG13